jgi:hypothetical protein
VRRFLRDVLYFLAATVVVPIALSAGIRYAQGWPTNWRSADWSSSGLLPIARQSPQATVIILATRTGNWKSIFAEHLSIVVKPEGASEWTRYDVVGWGEPVRKNNYPADGKWYGNVPRIIYQIDGDAAANAIPDIEKAIASYPMKQRGSYTVWPGPNSNTFVSWVARHAEGLDLELPPVAVGKDWLGQGLAFARAPSDTGYTVSLSGLIGATLAWEEGAELHLLGSTIGLDFNDLAIKLPGIGKLGFMDG